MKKRIAAGLLTCAITAFVAVTALAAPGDDYRYKWPWRHDTSLLYIGTYPFSGVHGCYPNGSPPYECVAAYDLNITNSVVVAANEGGVAVVRNDYQPDDCGSGKSYGNYVDTGGVRYAHLNSISGGVAQGVTMLQGDQVGVEGATGNVIPCPGGKHLHWQFLSGSVPTIDGGSATSTNSVIGEYSTAGLTLRTYYTNKGGWNTIGWTTKHCPGTCTLNMTNNLAWGRMQDFRHDPDWFGQEFATIHVANWDNTHAYRVDSVFWAPWAAGGWDVAAGFVRPISMAVQESGSCPAGSVAACVAYQRFHLGYVWLANNGVASAAFCPDVYPLPNGDNIVSASDAQWVWSFFRNGTYHPRADIDGNGVVSSGDAQIVLSNFYRAVRCRP